MLRGKLRPDRPTSTGHLGPSMMKVMLQLDNPTEGSSADDRNIATLPISCTKGSGWGRTNAGYGLEEFLELRTVTVTNPEIFASALRSKVQDGVQNGDENGVQNAAQNGAQNGQAWQF